MLGSTRRWSPLLALALLHSALSLAACEESAAPEVAAKRAVTKPALQVAASPTTHRGSPRHVDHRSGVSFRAPAHHQVEAEHFDPGPAGQMRHRLVLSRARQERLSVEVWENPTSLPVDQWFEQHLAFMRDGLERTRWAMMSGHRVRGLLIRRPRSPQAFGQRTAIFAAGRRVVRITCQDEDDARTLAAFQQVTASIRVEVDR